MIDLGLNPGDLLEIVNDNGVTQSMAYPMASLKRNTVAMVFGSPAGSQGNVVNPGVNELVLPNYKHTWGDIRKISDATGQTRGVSFKSHEIVL